jgi:hypothetical protein
MLDKVHSLSEKFFSPNRQRRRFRIDCIVYRNFFKIENHYLRNFGSFKFYLAYRKQYFVSLQHRYVGIRAVSTTLRQTVF